ncbi:MAG TPA: lysophospholipid acyltransferase family protein [Solirubrobacterales bacterium]|nr:lysophospholipid acyltransferase family protein [Solirubrobacterales bacterium]
MREPTRTYRIAMAVNLPVAGWARLEVSGVETLPTSGPLLLVGNHDSHWDPVMIGFAARKRRMIRALAKSTLWDVKGLHWVLDGMGQIPIVRGAGDAQALANAVTALREGSCVGVFPEGTRSKGREMRARSGVGRLALEVPEAHVSCVAVSGTTDLTGFPRRPHIKVRFFDPVGGQPRPDEDPGDLSARLLAEIRAIAPPTLAYRKRGKAEPGT